MTSHFIVNLKKIYTILIKFHIYTILINITIYTILVKFQFFTENGMLIPFTATIY